MNMSDGDWDALHRAGRRHDIVCLYVQDIRERELPVIDWGSGILGWLTSLFGYAHMLQDFTGARRLMWNTRKTREQYASTFRKHEASVLQRFKESRCRWLVVSTEEGDSAFPKLIKTFGAAR
jgi:hypothetical protein